MILRSAGASLVLIAQPDHAALASRVIAQWRANGFPSAPRRGAILRATAEHDNGWRELDASPLVDPSTGRIRDFIDVPGTLKRAVWPRGVMRLSSEPWCAALVAQHALHIYSRFRVDTEWAPFFAQMEELRDRFVREAAPLSLDNLLEDYLFVRVGDLISLTFCNGWTEPQSDLGGYVVRCDGNRLTVTPDPFEGRQIPIEITGRSVPNRPYPSDADAGREFERAALMTLTAKLSG